jgi:hypothetical protein
MQPEKMSFLLLRMPQDRHQTVLTRLVIIFPSKRRNGCPMLEGSWWVIRKLVVKLLLSLVMEEKG